jgi:hypothetical protein
LDRYWSWAYQNDFKFIVRINLKSFPRNFFTLSEIAILDIESWDEISFYDHGQGYLLLENKDCRKNIHLLRAIIPFNTIADRIFKSVNGRNRDRAQRCSCPWHLKNAVKVWNLRSCSDKGISLFFLFFCYTIQIVFENCFDLFWEKNVLVVKKKLVQIPVWRLIICKYFEITRTIY